MQFHKCEFINGLWDQDPSSLISVVSRIKTLNIVDLKEVYKYLLLNI